MLRNRYLFVCANRRPDGEARGSCAARGSLEIHAKLKELLRERQLANTEGRACSSSCLDACLEGPCIAVEPDHFFYTRVQLSDVDEIVDALRSGQRVERLVSRERD